MSSCKISSKSAKQFLRYRGFSIFKMAAVCRFGFTIYLNIWSLVRLEVLIFTAIPNFIKIGQTVAEISHLTFLKMATVRHFQFGGKFWNDPQRVFGGLYHCAKFGWNCFNCFDSTKVLIFCTFGLKTPIHANFGAVLGVKINENGNFLHSYPSANAVTRN